jgi:polyisoprenoid-binding protein YceI
MLNFTFIILKNFKTKKNMKKIFLFASMALYSLAILAQSTWKSDKAHSQLKFDITHYGINTVSGAFSDFDVTVKADKEDFSDAVVELKAKASSINTGITQRDDHLRSVDFFDVATFPELTYKSTGIKAISDKKFELSGDLTMHGITKPVTLVMELRGVFTNPRNQKKIAGIRVTGTVKRSDFGIGPKFPAASLSEEVTITGDGEFGM